MSETFENLGVIPALVTALGTANITVPTTIQAQVIPLALAGKDVIGQSATGTGKTLAYLLPLFQKLDSARRETQAMILAPTHELAIQIQRQIELLAQNANMPITSTPLIGNVNIARQIDKLKEKPHIIVGSAGRILELIQKRKISAQPIKTIVLDEADRLLDDNNLDSVKAVIKTTMKDRHIMLFSATITPATLARAKEFIPNPELITATGQAEVKPDITHMHFLAEQRDKIEVLRKLVAALKVDRALVFVNKGDDIEIAVAKLEYHGLKVAGLHGAAVKSDRKKALEDFRGGRIQLLVASDVAARGLDIPDIDFVFNLDMPEDPQVYVHRVGRTGRAGKSGTAISLVNSRELELIKKCEKVLDTAIPVKYLARGQVFDNKQPVGPRRRPKVASKVKK